MLRQVLWNTFSFALLPRLIGSTLLPTRPFPGPSSSGNNPLGNTTSALQLQAKTSLSEPATISPNEYPRDPFQLRVPGTATSLIFSKYGPPIHCETFLNLVAEAQYEVVQAAIAARGDGPVLQRKFEWTENKLYIRISRPRAREYLTWLMLADTLEGTRLFFHGRGWFETEIDILDDLAGPVGNGSIKFW